MIPAYLVVLYVLAILTILAAVRLKRRRPTSWQRGVPHELVATPSARLTDSPTNSRARKLDSQRSRHRATEIRTNEVASRIEVSPRRETRTRIDDSLQELELLSGKVKHHV